MSEIGVDDNSRGEICAVCRKAAAQKCGACKMIYYCSREHQKADWKWHSGKCRVYKLAKDSTVGRHYVASRKIEIGEIVMKEKVALLAAPPENTPPVCLACYANLGRTNSRPCDNCGWPMCLECKNHEGGECQLTIEKKGAKVAITEFGLPHPTYRSIGVIRALALRQRDPEAYRRLLNLEDHCHEASERNINGFTLPQDVAGFVKRFFKIDNVEEDEIAKIAGILQINGHEVPTSESPHIAVYDEASYLEHNCRANCSKSFTDKGGIVIRAAVPISKGDHLTICYTDSLWGVTNRRHHLAQTKFFDCACDRCKDPTEFGTMFNAIKCINHNCTGSMLPPTFLNTNELECPDYVCSKCGVCKSWEDVEEMLNKIGLELSKMQKEDVDACIKFLGKYSKILNENHFYMVDVKLALAQIIGQDKGGLPAVSDQLLTEKIILCKKLSQLLETLVPAENRIRGVLLFELHAGIAEFGRRQDPETLRASLMESRKVLSDAYELLRHEPDILPEGKMALQAKKNLLEMDVIIKTLVRHSATPA